jgi:uncharacterized protein with ATP-grasp and redox domains
MKTYYKCLPCLLRQTIEATKMVNETPETQEMHQEPSPLHLLANLTDDLQAGILLYYSASETREPSPPLTAS